MLSNPCLDRRDAEQRKRKKASAKKAAAEASRKTAEEKVRSHREQAQAKRSSAFAAARLNDTTAVKKAVWEDEVDAAGGGIRQGSEDLVKNPPADARETLMHIAAKHGNVELVGWLDSHSVLSARPAILLYADDAGAQVLRQTNVTKMI